MNGTMTYTFKALTDIWTGSVELKEKNDQIEERIHPRRLITTGLLGSIRWWFEVVVRGLGGIACDPSNTKCEGQNHCVVCELFGCTGWARKFRFKVTDKDGQVKSTQIKKDNIFILSFTPIGATPIRAITSEEWALLYITLRLIANYGAVGGKTVFKPSDEIDRGDQLYHRDFGLIKFMSTDSFYDNYEVTKIKKYIISEQWRKVDLVDFAWSSLKNFWYAGGKYLGRQDKETSTFNRVIGRPEEKEKASQNDSWIAGCRPDKKNKIDAESKKVFSFKNPPRTFGFVNAGLVNFNEIRQKLEKVWGKDGWDFLTGNEIIKILIPGEEVSI